MTILANGVFLRLLHEQKGLAAVPDQDLTAAGNAACDAMDRHDSMQSVLIVVAALSPGAATTTAVAAIAGAASGTLCPEHSNYLD